MFVTVSPFHSSPIERERKRERNNDRRESDRKRYIEKIRSKERYKKGKEE
jgi:hypothetical protein